MEALMRNFFLYFAKSPMFNKIAKKYGLHLGARKFVAGETIDQAIRTVKKLNEKGLSATLDHLGEFVNSKEEAVQSAEMCLKTLDAIHLEGVDANLSLKLTSLGLDVSEDLCLENMNTIVSRAEEYHNFVRIDMEDYAHCQKTIDIYKELRKNFDRVGTVIQAYLYRTEKDMEDLNQLNANLRLVKGAYKESPEVAFPDKQDVDQNFIKIIKTHLANENYTAIATHDDRVIKEAIQFVREHHIKNDQFEFQMLYGIREDLQLSLVEEGYKVRVYVPFGNDWFGYFMRRLAERPANVWFVLKNSVKK